MTDTRPDEERARDIATDAFEGHVGGLVPAMKIALATDIANALERARVEERERCAKIAESYPVHQNLRPAESIAAAIRKRGA